MENSSGKTSRQDENKEREVKLWSELKILKMKLKNRERLPQRTNNGGNMATCEQPISISKRLSSVSESDSYFSQAMGLDFLIGVPQILLFQTTDDTMSTSKFLVKIPEGETLYQGIENSSAIQKAVFCSGRNFTMTFLDSFHREAATFTRERSFTNIAKRFRQEMNVYTRENRFLLGRIMQDNIFSSVSFAIFDEKNQIVFKIICSKNSFMGKLNFDVHFSILDPVQSTGGVIIHKWDSKYRDFLYHIIFPSCDISVQNKMLLIGATLLVEYTYFKKTPWLCFS